MGTIIVSEKVGTKYNIFQTDVGDTKRTELKLNVKEITNFIKKVDCKDSVDWDYINKVLTTNTLKIIVGSLNAKTIVQYGKTKSIQEFEPIGFILAQEKDSTSNDIKTGAGNSSANKRIHLDVICGAGAGGILMNFFLKYVKEKGFTELSLNALPPVIAYYQRYGFQFRKSCKDIVVDISDLVARVGERARLVKEYQKSGEEVPAGIKLPITSNQAYADPDFRPYIQQLHQAGLSEYKGVRDGVKIDDCDKLDKTIDYIQAKNCGVDGYNMFICPPSYLPSATIARGGSRRSARRKNRKTRKMKKSRK